ncbi:MAG: ADP-ribosylglycohydrolase family protein [Pirellulales bacterium]
MLPSPATSADAYVGYLLGTAVGDALGLPYEGLSRSRAIRMWGPPDRMRFLLRYGMVSDDTEHACMVAQSLLDSGDDPAKFGSSLAWRLRWWFAGLPAGMGLATAKACIRLWLGMGHEKSGVHSAGNGPAMRAGMLGLAASDSNKLRELVRISSRLTHTDCRAEHGALAIALATQLAARRGKVEGEEYREALKEALGGDDAELLLLVESVKQSVAKGESTEEFALAKGWKKGVSGYMYQTVPAVLHAWLSYADDYRSAVQAVIRCGGDTDTTAALVGGIVGAAVGKAGIPEEWKLALWEWPRTVPWMEQLGAALHASANGLAEGKRPQRLSAAGIAARNGLFLSLVLMHGFRRLLPPYA